MKYTFLALVLGLAVGGCAAAKDWVYGPEEPPRVAESVGLPTSPILPSDEILVHAAPAEASPEDVQGSERTGFLQALFGAIFVLVQALLKYFFEGRKAGAT